MKKILYYFLIFLFCSQVVIFAETTTNSAVFLRIHSSARTAAIGGTGNAIFGDVSNTEINPANMYWITNKQLFFSHNEWFEGIRSEYFAYALPLNNSVVIALSGKILSIDDIKRTDDSGNYLGDFGARDSVYTFSVAKKFFNRLSIGMNLKTIEQKIDNEKGNSLATDFGVLYNTTRFFTFAAGVRNIGGDLAIYEEGFPLPLTYTMGLSYYSQGKYHIAFDTEKEINCEPVFRFGMEYFVMERLDIRAGYIYTKEDYETSGISLGFGINLQYRLFLDYAYVPFGDLGDTHRISLKYNF
jgi:hypothetical protein